jgi:acyl CoA:acetate/3-ketoacid CoA transferase beta subunit
MSGATRAEVCIAACAEAWRGDGEILASPMGVVPTLGAKLARATFEPDLLLTDGVASLVSAEGAIEGRMPYRAIFDVVWSGRRHVMMGAAQIDRFGNQNISCIGDWKQPKVQLLGVRGAPGNTINHPTSYWVANHNRRVFVERVDMVSGVGCDRARELGEAGSRFHDIRRIVTNLAVMDFATPDGRMRILSIHPWTTLEEVEVATGFELVRDDAVATTPVPDAEALRILREILDPDAKARSEVPE